MHVLQAILALLLDIVDLTGLRKSSLNWIIPSVPEYRQRLRISRKNGCFRVDDY